MAQLGFDPVEEARRHWVEHGWPEAAPGMAAVTSIMRAQQLLLARIDSELKPFALTFARYEVLMLLTFTQTGQLPLNKVGQRLQVHPTSVTSAIDRLEKQGLVKRVPHPTDRRTTLAALTEDGRELAARATKALNASVFADPGVPAGKLSPLVATLRSMRRSAGDFA
jgi:DNA-binding MarR family transcriptional regulator